MAGDTASTGGVGVAAGCTEVTGVGVGFGVGIGVGIAIGGTAPVSGATTVGIVSDPQARLSKAVAERINMSMENFIIPFAPWQPRMTGANLVAA